MVHSPRFIHELRAAGRLGLFCRRILQRGVERQHFQIHDRLAFGLVHQLSRTHVWTSSLWQVTNFQHLLKEKSLTGFFIGTWRPLTASTWVSSASAKAGTTTITASREFVAFQKVHEFLYTKFCRNSWDYKTSELPTHLFNFSTAFIDLFAWIGNLIRL